MQICRTAVLCSVVSALHPASMLAEESEQLFRNPTFEELADATVTSVTRAPMSQFSAPAAAYVLTAQDVRSAGARTIPDALRFAPGLQVAQFDAHTWAVASRGFGTLFVDKLLVLVDGRSVYTPLWSGVYWEQHGMLDQDLDRIEVIRGPGGSTWGANAVNGVINILGKSARNTQGLALEVGGGNQEQAFGGVRYGGTLWESSFYRVYVNFQERDDTEVTNGRDSGDAWNMARGGVRFERDQGDSHLMIKSEVHSGDFDDAKLVATPQAPFVERAGSGSSSGVLLQTEWSHRLSDHSELRVEGWWEQFERRLAPSNEESQTLKLELQYRTSLGPHTVVTELGYRDVDHEGIPNFIFALSPARRTFDVWSAAIQDEIALATNLALTAGARIEYHDFVGWEWQPNLRLSWQPTDLQSLWLSAGRAVRTPNISNEGGLVTLTVTPPGALGPGSPATIQQVVGNPDVESEELTAWELGWRLRLQERAMINVSTFYNKYDQLITYAAQPLDTTTLAPAFWRIPLLTVNGGSGHSYGAELTAVWMPLSKWQLDFEFTYLDLQVDPSSDPFARQLSGSSPRRQASVRSSYELAENWQLSAALRYVGELESLQVPDYIAADVRLARQIGRGMELAIVGRDLWDDRHPEFRSGTYLVDSYIERSFFVTFAWRL